MTNQFIFFCGGSGARAAEAYAYCAAMGLMGCDNNVRIVLCDADAQMGNVSQAVGILQQYQSIRDGIYNNNTGEAHSGDIFCTPITVSQWDMDSRDPQRRMANYTLRDLADNVGQSDWVIKALFSQEEERKSFSNLGFFAHPNVGSAVVQAAILCEKDIAAQHGIASTYNRLKNEMKACLNGNHDVHVFFVGSLFGGTGASCMPTIASDLRTDMREYLQDNPQLNSQVIMGACMMLPFFSIPRAPNPDAQLVKPELFVPSTKMALSYYIKHNQGIFDVIYPLGLPHPYTLPDDTPHFGGASQKNPMSFVEWSAAAACLHFVNNGAPAAPNPTPCCGYLEENDAGRIVLNDNSFMMPQFGPAFVRWMNFVSFYTLYLHPNIQLGHNRRCSANWYGNYVRGQDVDQLDNQINDFCRKYYNGLYEMLGMTLNEDERPENALVDSSKWNTIRDFLQERENRSWKTGDVKRAHRLMHQKGFKLVLKTHENHCDASRLIRSLSTDNAGNGAFGNMLQIVNSALK